MSWMIPFASALSEAGVHTLRELPLPNLAALLARSEPVEHFGGDEEQLNLPHEHALAAAQGWPRDDGLLPLAAHAARADGLDPGDAAWALLTPVHWKLSMDHAALTDPAELQLGEDESRTLFEAVRPLFEDEGFRLAWGAPLRWYAAHDSLAGVPTASLDRVIGRAIEPWLRPHPQARLIRRLQNEVQMLLYGHPANEARAARNRPTVNSFWLWGCGRAQPPAAPALRVDERLRAPLLAGDWAGWAEAWQALDAEVFGPLRARAEGGEPVAFVLAGERVAQRFETRPVSLWQRLKQRLDTPSAAPVLEAL